MKRLALSYPSREALRSDHAEGLSKGRAFIAGPSDVGERETCEIAIQVEGGEEAFVVSAEVVWLGPSGVGFAVALDPERKAALAAFVERAGIEVEAPPADEPAERGARNIHERVRALGLREREEVARRGALSERVALERAFGASVWEGLLQNPQLTVSEVARIAKNGTLPKPLVSVIVGNGAWLASSEVQRALLTNPRCSGPHLDRVLHAMSRSDLSRLAQSCPYRAEVRAAVQKLVRR